MERSLFFRMSRRREGRFFVFGAVLLAIFCLPALGLEEGKLNKVTAVATVSDEDQPWRYFLFLPEGYHANTARKWPTIFWLHGRSLRGDDLEMLRRYGPPSFLRKKPEFPYLVICPQLPDGSWPATGLKKLLDECRTEYQIDPDRIHLTGDSLGAMGAWNFAGSFPEAFASLTPVTAHGPSWVAKKLVKLPIRAWHGDSDEAVPMEEHVALIQRIEELGGDADLKIIPEGTHGSVIGMNWRDPEWFAWLEIQKREKE
jgi:predicted peptidase